MFRWLKRSKKSNKTIIENVVLKNASPNTETTSANSNQTASKKTDTKQSVEHKLDHLVHDVALQKAKYRLIGFIILAFFLMLMLPLIIEKPAKPKPPKIEINQTMQLELEDEAQNRIIPIMPEAPSQP